MANAKEVVAEQVYQAVQHQSDITIFVWCFGLIMALLIYILKDKENSNKSRHQDNEKQISHLADISTELKEIVIANKIKTENNTKRIDEVAKKVNTK